MTSQRILAGSSGSAIKSHNVRAILLTLLRDQVVSRIRLAGMTGLSATTITNLVNELLDQGVLTEENNHPRKGRRRVGRPQTGLRIQPESRYALAVHVDVDQLIVALTDLYARPLQVRSVGLHTGDRPEEMLRATVAMADEIIQVGGIEKKRIVGVGVGASGLVDPTTGVNLIAPNLGWRDVPLRDWLSDALRLPVCVDNNVRAMAMAEALFGAGRDCYSLAFVYSRVGVGAGLVVGGQIYRGSGAGAGEIGHTTIIPEGGELCRCGNTGCLETLASEPAIVRAAQALAEQNRGGLLAQYLREGMGRPIEQVFAAARAGDPAARGLLDERARYMGIALANLVNVLNPEVIVMGGIFATGKDVLLPTIESTLRARAFAGLGERARLCTTSFEGKPGLVGAASLALNTFFYQQEAA